MDAIDKFSITSLADNQEFKLDGNYIIEDGKLGDYEIPFSGNAPITGRLTYKNNDFINGIVEYDDYYVLIYGKETKIINIPKNNSDGLYASSLEMDKGRYLYRGKNPNNYIWLDENGDNKKQENELYRIMSYENDGTIRIIRIESIGDMVFGDNLNNSNWAFYGNQYNTYTEGIILDKYTFKYFSDNKTSDLVVREYSKEHDSNLNSFLNSDWINSTQISNYITSHLFNVGGIFYHSGYNGGDKGIEKEKIEVSLNQWYGKIGIISITDMVESSNNKNCISVYGNYGFNNQSKPLNNNWPCTTDNWLHNKGSYEWTSSTFYNALGYVWIIDSKGFFQGLMGNSKFSVRPSFFLRSDLSFSGEGTKANPYVIENF